MTTSRQRQIASLLGLDISNDSKRVASAKILDSVFTAIYPEKQQHHNSPEQIDFAKSLGIYVEDDTRNIISARISDELETRNLNAIQSLGLSRGDKVRVNRHGTEGVYEISSIASNHRLWFKGGCGKGAWPTQVIEKI
jgi:hypothetical protein